MKLVAAPEGITGLLPRPFIFLAGGIQNCPEWQKELICLLVRDDFAGSVFNPRRDNFPIHDPNAALEQITWEFNALALSDVVSFWFSRGSDNPIVMLEYGKHLMRYTLTGRPKIVVGCDPEYSRVADVKIQTALELPGLVVHDRLVNVATAIWRAK